MKRHLLIISALVLLVVLLAASPLTRNSAASPAAGGGEAGVTIELNSDSVQLGDSFVVTGAAVSGKNPSPVRNGWIIFDHLADGNGNPLPCGTDNTYDYNPGDLTMFDFKHLTRDDNGTYTNMNLTGAGAHFTTAGKVGLVAVYQTDGKPTRYY